METSSSPSWKVQVSAAVSPSGSASWGQVQVKVVSVWPADGRRTARSQVGGLLAMVTCAVPSAAAPKGSVALTRTCQVSPLVVALEGTNGPAWASWRSPSRYHCQARVSSLAARLGSVASAASSLVRSSFVDGASGLMVTSGALGGPLISISISADPARSPASATEAVTVWVPGTRLDTS